MSSSSTLKDANRLISERRDLLQTFLDPKRLLVMHFLYRRGARSIEQISDELKLPLVEVESIALTLIRHGLISSSSDASYTITQLAYKRLNTGSFSLDLLVGSTLGGKRMETSHPLSGTYEVKELIGRGATSFTFRAEQSGTHLNRALKIFLPGVVTLST